MLSRVRSASLYGIDAHPVDVEVDISGRGLPHFFIVGLPDASVKESRDRVRAALKNTGFDIPPEAHNDKLGARGLEKRRLCLRPSHRRGALGCRGAS